MYTQTVSFAGICRYRKETQSRITDLVGGKAFEIACKIATLLKLLVNVNEFILHALHSTSKCMKAAYGITIQENYLLGTISLQGNSKPWETKRNRKRKRIPRPFSHDASTPVLTRCHLRWPVFLCTAAHGGPAYSTEPTADLVQFAIFSRGADTEVAVLVSDESVRIAFILAGQAYFSFTSISTCLQRQQDGAQQQARTSTFMHSSEPWVAQCREYTLLINCCKLRYRQRLLLKPCFGVFTVQFEYMHLLRPYCCRCCRCLGK